MKESLVEQLLSRIMNWEDNKIVEELPQPDGSLIIHIKKQYLHHDCGTYLD